MKKRDYYAILGVQRDASQDDLKKAYRKLAMKLHPDRNKDDPASEERFKEVNEAYAVLGDVEKRKKYDQFGADGFGQRFSQEDIFKGFDFQSIFSDLGFGGAGRPGSGGAGGGGAGDFFSSIFGGGGRRRTAHGRGRSPFVDVEYGPNGFGPGGPGAGGGAPKGKDIRSLLEVSFHESIFGGSRRIAVKAAGKKETLTVRIPPDVETGKKLRVTGKGEPSPFGGPNGDLYLELKVAPHPFFERDGRDIHVKQSVALTLAVLGGQVKVPTIAGETKQIRIPPGTQNETKIRMRGFGVPSQGETPAGDQYVRVHVDLPKDLTDDQKDLFEKLQQTGI